MNLAARTPQEFDIIKTQEVININIQPETILKGHALQHGPNDLSEGHASEQEPMYALRHEPNDLSVGRASQQDPMKASRHEPNDLSSGHTS